MILAKKVYLMSSKNIDDKIPDINNLATLKKKEMLMVKMRLKVKYIVSLT